MAHKYTKEQQVYAPCTKRSHHRKKTFLSYSAVQCVELLSLYVCICAVRCDTSYNYNFAIQVAEGIYI